MNEIRRSGRELIAAARLERTPSARERQRVLGALMASATLTSAASAVAAPSFLRKLMLGAGKWWVLAGAGAAGVAGAHLVISARGSTAIPASHAAAVQQIPAPKPQEASLPVQSAVDAPPPPTRATGPSAASQLRPPQREASDLTLEQELVRLHAAHAAYRNGQPAQALALVGKHQRAFPYSQLAVERSTLEILSLCAMGRPQRAKQLATKLRATARGSAAVSGLEGSCAADAAK